MNLKKILASTLAAAILLSSMSMAALANNSNATAGNEDVLAVGENFSTVYYGGIPWRVLSKEFSDNSENAKDGILLLSEHVMASGIQYNAHYSNGAWSSDNKIWASAMVMPWNDERHPNYEYNIENNVKNDDSSGGYLTSDIRAYLTGQGSYEVFRPFAYYNESWPASWDTMPDRNGQGWRYYTRNIVTESAPIEGVTYFVKGEFEISDHNRNSAKVNGVDVPGMVTITPADWAEDTWYTLGRTGYTLLTQWPEGTSSINAFYDQAGYSIADVSNGFEDGVTYYTFERLFDNVCPKVVCNGVEYAMGEHLAGLYKWVGYAVPDLNVSDHNDALTNKTFVAGLSAQSKNFASDIGLSDIELEAVLPTSGHGFNRGAGVNHGWSGNIGSTFADRLENDTFFSLSGDEVYTYLTSAGHTKPATYLDGTAAGDIWTRSWGRADIQTVITYANNAINWYKGANTWWQGFRPAFNLNPDAVLFYAPVNDVDFAEIGTNSDNTYKLTLTDDSRDLSVTGATRSNGSYTISYSGAKTGSNEYISGALYDAEDNMIAYGKLGKVTGESGSVTVDLSSFDMSDKTLYIFNEECNGENMTNYASALAEVANVTDAAAAVAKIGNTPYETLQAAIDAAQNGDTITVVADVADEAVYVDKNVIITGQQTLNNISFNAVDGCTELAVKNLSFTGNSWINSGAADKLTVSGVTADVTPANTAYTNSRSAFISLGRSEQKLLDLVVENCNIVSRGGSDPVLGWAGIKTATLTGNTFGSETAYQENSDSVKFMSINADAVFTITNNTVYSNYNGIVLAQNTTRDNAYTATFAGNKFYGGADHIWIEVSGSTTTHAKIRVSSDNTINGNAMTIGDVKYHPNIKSWTGYIGLDVKVNSNDEITGGTFTVDPTHYIAEGCNVTETNGMYTVSKEVEDSILQNAPTSKAEAAGLEAFSGETGGIKWCSYSFLVNMNGQSSISATVSVNGEEKPLQTKNNWNIGANIDGNTAFGVVVTGVDAVDSITVDVQ